MLTLKYSGADGSVLWQRRSNGSANSGDAAAVDDEAYATAAAVAVDSSGNVVVTGTSYNSTDQNGTAYSAIYTSEWWYSPRPYSVAVDSRGNVVFTGISSNGSIRDFEFPCNASRSNFDFYTAKQAAADGALLWEKRYDGPGYSFSLAKAVAVDRIGDVVVTGYSADTDNPDLYTAKYAAGDSTLLWEHQYTDPPGEYRSI